MCNSTPPPPTQYLCRQIYDLIALMKSRIILPNFKVLRPCAVLEEVRGGGLAIIFTGGVGLKIKPNL